MNTDIKLMTASDFSGTKHDPKKAVLNDGRALHVLNRKERQVYKKLRKDDDNMAKINLLTPVEAFGGDGQIIKNQEQKIPTLKEVLLISLRQPLGVDQSTGMKEKQERYLLIKRLNAVDEIELSDKERQLLDERTGRVHLQVEIAGRVHDLLFPEVEAPKEEPKP